MPHSKRANDRAEMKIFFAASADRITVVLSGGGCVIGTRFENSNRYHKRVFASGASRDKGLSRDGQGFQLFAGHHVKASKIPLTGYPPVDSH